MEFGEMDSWTLSESSIIHILLISLKFQKIVFLRGVKFEFFFEKISQDFFVLVSREKEEEEEETIKS